MTKSNPSTDADIAGPAIITHLHILGRPATTDDMRPIVGKEAWSKISKVLNVYNRGQLNGGNRKYTPKARIEVAEQFAKLFDLWRPGTTDSTQKLNVSRSTGGGGRQDASIDAGNRIAAINRHLGARDKKILEMVFEHEEWPAIAVKEVTGDYEDARPARFRESLDALIEAWETVRREGYKRVAGGVVL